MKHIDTRYNWIKQFVDNEIVDIKYIKSENNVADICIKNLLPKLFEKHSSKLISDVGFFCEMQHKTNRESGNMGRYLVGKRRETKKVS